MAERLTYGPGIPVIPPSAAPMIFDGKVSFERLPDGRIHGRFYRVDSRFANGHTCMECFFKETDVEAWTIWATRSFLPDFWTGVREALHH
jgi:hypothetical protein